MVHGEPPQHGQERTMAFAIGTKQIRVTEAPVMVTDCTEKLAALHAASRRPWPAAGGP